MDPGHGQRRIPRQAAVVRARVPIDVPAGLRLWTDDYSSLFPIIEVAQKAF
jgi:hypothetical protein